MGTEQKKKGMAKLIIEAVASIVRLLFKIFKKKA